MIRIRPRHAYAARKLAQVAQDRSRERAWQRQIDSAQEWLRLHYQRSY